MKNEKNQTNVDTLECLFCGKDVSLTTNVCYKHNNDGFEREFFPVHKNCIQKYMGNNKDVGYSDKVIDILRMLNRPYIHSSWIKNECNFGKYLKELSLSQNKSLTFRDSEFATNPTKNITDNSISDELRMFWRGYSDEDIKELDFNFSTLTEGYESESLVQEMLLKQIAVTQLKANRSANTKEYTDLVSTISKLMTDANIKPTQKNSTNQSEAIFGAWIKKIEEDEPIPEPLDKFKDLDGISRYLDKYFISHFSKLFGIRSSNESELE